MKPRPYHHKTHGQCRTHPAVRAWHDADRMIHARHIAALRRAGAYNDDPRHATTRARLSMYYQRIRDQEHARLMKHLGPLHQSIYGY